MADVWLCDMLAVLSQGLVNDLGSAGTSWAQEDMRQEDQDSLLCPCDTLCVRALYLGEKSMLWDLFSTARIAATSPLSHLLSSSLCLHLPDDNSLGAALPARHPAATIL